MQKQPSLTIVSALLLTIICSSLSFVPLAEAGVVDQKTTASTNVTTVPPPPSTIKDATIYNNNSLNLDKKNEPSVVLEADVSEPRDFGLSLLLIVAVSAIFLLPLLALLALIFLFPLPSIYFPLGTLTGVNNPVLVTGRRDKSFMNRMMGPETASAVRGILESDICMQRISCEIMRASKGLRMDKWVSRVMNELPMRSELKWKITRAAQASRNCKRYICDPMSSISSSIWNMFFFRSFS